MKIATALRTLISPKRAALKNIERESPMPQHDARESGETQITLSLPAALAEWLRSYAYTDSKTPSHIAAAALACAKARTASAQYTEPGTSVTHMGVAEVEFTLTTDDAKWLLGRAAQDQVSHCAVFHAALSHYSEIAPAHDFSQRKSYIVGQELYYKQITGVCSDVDAGRLTAEEADKKLADAVAVRLYRLLPEVERDTIRAAAHAAIRELCLNHPALRQAHGRDKVPAVDRGKLHPSEQGDAPRDSQTQ